ncbi:sigma-70 family RNA polymerase sigma factor [Streptomyces sp. NPDC091281]|uniref:sigma-70 family RNA polymerase sigma factor n=1 Tax=Streptomyces sp. NPDC091281 TaxID=3365985 RepID=UPI0038202C30
MTNTGDEHARETGVTGAADTGGRTARTRDREQDEAFVRAIYDKHGVVLLRITTGMLSGDSHRAQDLVQEAVLRAWRHADILDPDAEGVRPWLVTVIRNLVIDNHRARQARPPETVDTELSELPGPEHMDRVLNRKVVREALGDLTVQHREVLLHVQFLDHSVEQTAEALGIPQGTVKSRTHNALNALRNALAARGFTP